MRLTYCANGVAGHIDLPIACVEVMTAESLAELAASCHWRDHHPTALPGELTRVHLQDLDGKELGMFEVRREMRPVFTASRVWIYAGGVGSPLHWNNSERNQSLRPKRD